MALYTFLPALCLLPPPLPVHASAPARSPSRSKFPHLFLTHRPIPSSLHPSLVIRPPRAAYHVLCLIPAVRTKPTALPCVHSLSLSPFPYNASQPPLLAPQAGGLAVTARPPVEARARSPQSLVPYRPSSDVRPPLTIGL